MFGIEYPLSGIAPGRHLDLPGRGRTFIRELSGPPGARTVILLHGWITPGGWNFHTAAKLLARQYHVVMMDMRGHGRGLRDGRPFSLEACAGDVAALIRVLNIERPILAGYSMGATVAAMTWHHHPGDVGGLVLVSTTAHDHSGPIEKPLLWALGKIFARLPDSLFTSWWIPRWMAGNRWFRPLDEVGRDDPRRVVEAARALDHYDMRGWLGRVNVPTAVVISARDLLVSPKEQREVLASIPTAAAVELRGGHLAWLWRTARFATALGEGCERVDSAPGGGLR